MVVKGLMENWLIYSMVTGACMWLPTIATITMAITNEYIELAILGGFCVALSIYGSIKLYKIFFK